MDTTPQIDVVRGRLAGLELRAVSGTAMPTLAGHFSRFNEWYEIHSWMEGDFIERFGPGAFAGPIQPAAGVTWYVKADTAAVPLKKFIPST